jgi:CheY-like chemotaxis protein
MIPPGVRVLELDPKGYSARLLSSILPALGIDRFHRVSNTEQALAYLRTEPVDVMFCDESAGFDELVFFMGNIRPAINSDPAVPILVVTEGMSQGQVSALRDAGASDVICKPMSCEVVRRKLEAGLLKPNSVLPTKAYLEPKRSGDPLARPDRR